MVPILVSICVRNIPVVPKVHTLGMDSAEFRSAGRCFPKPAQIRWTLPHFFRFWAELGRYRVESGGSQSKSGRIRPNLTNFVGQRWPGIGQTCPLLGCLRTQLGQCRPTLVRNRLSVCRCRRMLGPKSAEIWAASADGSTQIDRTATPAQAFFFWSVHDASSPRPQGVAMSGKSEIQNLRN